MKFSLKMSLLLVCSFPILLVASQSFAEESQVPPKVGATASEVKLKELKTDREVSLQATLKDSPVVLVVLRGYPGYQCPLCSRQVGALIQAQKGIAATGAEVILVYPGLDAGLETKAKEFFQKHQLPKNFTVVTDPNYVFTNQYDLRWDAPRETAYPSTFVINKDGKIVSAKVSRSHGDRSSPQSVLKVLKSL